ncbi:rod shape-determining protein MreC [Virgibacillus sp. W0430]|uniref:rod shape-determining protein MreC n=1 Tax=Virgibacillus sp. W0430 TaxID=3391580 RepID=UPI003F44BE38
MSFFQKKRLFFLLIGMIILVVLIGYSLTNREQLSTPEKFVLDTVGLVQNTIQTPVKYVTGIFGNVGDFKNTYKENELLKNKLAEYKSLAYEVQELKEENEQLRKALNKTDSIHKYKAIQATVISRSPERWIEQVTINKGSAAGVKENMAVITPEGMIGKIQAVSTSASTVKLLTGFDQFNRISATISRDGKDIVGLIEEYDKETDSLLFKIIEESDKDLEQDELVVSSGLGGLFPAGLPIGTVKEVIPDQYGLTRTALVKPAADMYDISHVIVVDREAPGIGAIQELKEDEES